MSYEQDHSRLIIKAGHSQPPNIITLSLRIAFPAATEAEAAAAGAAIARALKAVLTDTELNRIRTAIAESAATPPGENGNRTVKMWRKSNKRRPKP